MEKKQKQTTKQNKTKKKQNNWMIGVRCERVWGGVGGSEGRENSALKQDCVKLPTDFLASGIYLWYLDALAYSAVLRYTPRVQ